MKQSVFREIALKRLSSPEQLDQLIKITSLRAWLVLLGLGLILASVIVWGFLGSIPTKIEGQGILLNNGGVFTLTHISGGQVLDIRFKSGDMVKKGDIVARIEQPELVEEINDLLRTLEDRRESRQTDSPEYQAIQVKIAELQKKLFYESQIVSPITGRIVEMNMQEGSMVLKGGKLADIEQYDSTVRLEAVLYVAAEQGKEIRPGMEVQISPSTVNKEEYGYMMGRVTSIADYPATAQSMTETLGNEALVSLLAGKGVPVEVKVDLTPDSGTVSGYKWSSPAGPAHKISSGTLIQGEVVIKREKPVDKVIPFFRSGEQ